MQVAEFEGISVNQRGRRWWACCPLHGERTPSLMIDERGGWHCFGCGASGDGIALFAALHGLSQYEAAKRLAAIFGLRTSDRRFGGAESSRRTEKARADRDRLDTFEAWALQAGNVLATWLRTLDVFKRDLEPQTSDDEFLPIYVWICQELECWEEIYFTSFVWGGFRERVDLYRECREEVEVIGRVLEAIGETGPA